MTTYKTECWGETFEITADFALASCHVYGVEGGKQVADFRHSPSAAMRAAIEECAVAGGSDPDDDEVSAEIDAAVDAMVEVGSVEDAEADGFDRIGETDCYVRVKKCSDFDMVTWRIEADEVDDEKVFARLTLRWDMTAQEAIASMAEDGPRDYEIVRSVLDCVWRRDKFDAIYRHDGHLIVTDGLKIVDWDMDEDDAVKYAVEKFDADEDEIRGCF